MKNTGCFTDAFAEVTTDTRLTSMTAVAIPQAGLLSAPVTRQARLLVETPLLSLPPVLNNSLSVVVTNKTQSLKAYEGELFRLDLMNPVEELSNIFYPDNGLISMELDGNNVFDPSQIGSWTNRLSNTALTDNWFQQGDLADPPVLPSGCTYAGTRFDVGDLQVSIAGGNNGLAAITAATITTNASLLLQQSSDGTNWSTAQTIPGSSGAFSNVNLGWPTRLVGTKDLYNPAFHNIDRVPFMNVGVDNCLGMLRITVNAAVTNLSITGNSYGTNIDLTSAGNNGFLTENLGLPSDTYEILATGYGPPISSTNTVAGSLSYDLAQQPGRPVLLSDRSRYGRRALLLERQRNHQSRHCALQQQHQPAVLRQPRQPLDGARPPDAAVGVRQRPRDRVYDRHLHRESSLPDYHHSAGRVPRRNARL